jgi:hypothetical protein
MTSVTVKTVVLPCIIGALPLPCRGIACSDE